MRTVGLYARVVKRPLDLTVSLAALILAAPLMLIVSVAIVLVMGRPLLFRQQRVGLANRVFTIFKFRTMVDDGRTSDEHDGDRITRLGRWLRRTSLDELPELFNIVRGDMSLVGPRPLLVRYLPRYSVVQARRHEVRPGLTGWAQVNGRNALSWPDKFRFDVFYVDHMSAWLDLRIVVLTVVQVLRGRGISEHGHASAREFMG